MSHDSADVELKCRKSCTNGQPRSEVNKNNLRNFKFSEILLFVVTDIGYTVVYSFCTVLASSGTCCSVAIGLVENCSVAQPSYHQLQNHFSTKMLIFFTRVKSNCWVDTKHIQVPIAHKHELLQLNPILSPFEAYPDFRDPHLCAYYPTARPGLGHHRRLGHRLLPYSAHWKILHLLVFTRSRLLWSFVWIMCTFELYVGLY